MTGFDRPPTLATVRLTLGPAAGTHAEAFTAFCATDAARVLGGPVDRDDARSGVAMPAGQRAPCGFGTFGVGETATGAPVGRAGTFHPGRREEPDQSRVIHPAFRRRGYATEAARASRTRASDALDLGPLTRLIVPANAASERGAERPRARNEEPRRADAAHVVNRWHHPAPRVAA